MTTQTSIAGIKLKSYVFNASGPRDVTLAELKKIGESAASAIMMKSCTIKPRLGNEEPRYAALPYGSIQSMGLPNLGYQEYIKMIPVLKKYDKPVFASVAGLSPADFPIMVKAFQQSAVDAIEVNLSCPNIKGKPQVAYDFIASANVLKKISRLGKKPLGLKLPAYCDLAQQQMMAKLIKKFGIKFVTCINSLGNCLVIDGHGEKPVIKPKQGLGGLGGQYIKPVALANVRMFYELLPKNINLIGVGGISSGQDAFEFLLAGAAAVQVGTAFQERGPACFNKIDDQLVKILTNKKYPSINSAKGKLKFL
ncbi:MAG: dihydroorotate oxidase [Candidatus Komeilibacteria bacterium]|nr:dihydroorotate oxidase [Candidatus Komeilibacteria bacterium]